MFFLTVKGGGSLTSWALLEEEGVLFDDLHFLKHQIADQTLEFTREGFRLNKYVFLLFRAL
jgi:hypothetical protein